VEQLQAACGQLLFESGEEQTRRERFAWCSNLPLPARGELAFCEALSAIRPGACAVRRFWRWLTEAMALSDLSRLSKTRSAEFALPLSSTGRFSAVEIVVPLLGRLQGSR